MLGLNTGNASSMLLMKNPVPVPSANFHSKICVAEASATLPTCLGQHQIKAGKIVTCLHQLTVGGAVLGKHRRPPSTRFIASEALRQGDVRCAAGRLIP